MGRPAFVLKTAQRAAETGSPLMLIAAALQELRKPQFGSDGPPAFYAERADSEQGKPALLLRRATPEQVTLL